MNNYHFTVVVRDARANLSELEDKFFEAGCDDALLCSYNDTIYLEFDREADNAEQAVSSALNDIRSLGFHDLIVEEQGYSTLAEMAERAGMTRQALSLYAQNKRGDGNFPRPMYGLASKSAMYFWPEVATWLFNQGKLHKNHYEVARTVMS
ncbi:MULTISPECIES: XRE family transcriptional regulator [Acinetobacter]|uniref:XRE family transcriptional regulator n=1 Tax=Acinetobacter TaxID=469 RepID=UPI00144455D4|nr:MULTISPECIES: XRE family transcriptional regulator [Acinetobacter]MDM1486641.1 XRE family transcriptional regulator [Acinetobacter towneri]MEB6564597.1 XRE family transcriptional regulator [Acinetobacter towneri]